MNLIDYRASRIAAFAVGAFILLAATLLSQSLWDAIARATLLAVVAFAMMFAPKRLGVLSWSAGVPAFYGLFFLLLPLPQTLYGNNPLESDHGTANALLIAASGLFAFFVGAMTVHLTKKPPSTFAIAKVHPLDILEKPTAIAIAITVASIALLWSYFFGYFGLIATTGQDVAGGAGPRRIASA